MLVTPEDEKVGTMSSDSSTVAVVVTMEHRRLQHRASIVENFI
jgi:hypothetical protein